MIPYLKYMKINTKNNKSKKGFLHGECLIYESDIPSDAIAENIVDHTIIAESEQSGNHHVIDIEDGIKFFKTKDGRRFVSNTTPMNVRCVIAERHDAYKIPPGNWQIDFQREYDYMSEAERRVAD